MPITNMPANYTKQELVEVYQAIHGKAAGQSEDVSDEQLSAFISGQKDAWAQAPQTSQDTLRTIGQKRERPHRCSEKPTELISRRQAMGGQTNKPSSAKQRKSISSIARRPFRNASTQAERRLEMLNLLAQSNITIPLGITAAIGQANDDQGVSRSLHSYSGIVFRADTRSFDQIVQAGGFTSRRDLSVTSHRQEAQGIRSDGRGATGRSGVSCASDINGAYNYGRFDERGNRCRMYVIDTRLIGDETAYDMSATVRNNAGFGTDNTGAEVNLTAAPIGAVVGYLEFSPQLRSYRPPTFTSNPNYTAPEANQSVLSIRSNSPW